VPLITHVNKSKVRQGFRELAGKLMASPGAEQQGHEAKKSGGLLSKFFSD
jgi:hypothetical protein